jgi:hypothetical protein
MPPSATPASLAVAGLVSLLLACWALFGMQLLGPLHTTQAAGWATAALLAAVGGGMSLFDLLWLRTWQRNLVAVRQQALRVRAARVLRKWLGLHATLAAVAAESRFQFERHGYFVVDRVLHTAAAPVFNRITGLKDSWGK